MAKSLHELELNLKNYIIDCHSNYKGLKNVAVERYNNLRLSLDPEIYQTYHIVIRIGISEAVMILPEALIFTGTLGMDEKYVQRWLQLPAVQQELSSHWSNCRLYSA